MTAPRRRPSGCHLDWLTGERPRPRRELNWSWVALLLFSIVIAAAVDLANAAPL